MTNGGDRSAIWVFTGSSNTLGDIKLRCRRRSTNPVAPDDITFSAPKEVVPDDSSEVILKCQKVSTPKAYELLPVNGNE